MVALSRAEMTGWYDEVYEMLRLGNWKCGACRWRIRADSMSSVSLRASKHTYAPLYVQLDVRAVI